MSKRTIKGRLHRWLCTTDTEEERTHAALLKENGIRLATRSPDIFIDAEDIERAAKIMGVE